MIFDQHKHHRKSIRLKGYDYSQSGWYFVTSCTQNREMLFGDIINDKMAMNTGGEIVKKCWNDIPDHYHNVVLDEYVIMPNHIHGIIYIENDMDNREDLQNVRDIEIRAKNISPLPNTNKFHSPSKTIGSTI